jgi:DNA-binding NtrC family response regulator
LPPLRQRKEDIPLLAYHFLQKYARRAGRDIKRISVEALRQLRDQPWPGNVRELENAIEHAVVMARGDSILPTDLPFTRTRQADDEAHETTEPLFATEVIDLPYADAKERANQSFDKAYVERLMHRTSNNVSEAARQAGMDRSNFRRLLKKVRGQGKGDGDDFE